MGDLSLHRLVTWTRWQPRLHSEIALLIVLSVAAAGVFFGTRMLAASNASLRRHDSDAWLERGTDALHRGDVDSAVAALRRAAQVDRTNEAVDVVLAAALERAGDPAAAELVLVDRRNRTPDDSEVNVALARLEARRGRVDDAVRYYQSALDTLWSNDAADAGRRLREELIDLLLANGQRGPALSQVLILAAALGSDPPSQIQLGRLFLRAGDARRALDRFTSSLAADPHSREALAGAGEAAFDLHQYANAQKYFLAAGALDPRRRRERDISSAVVASDPLAARLSPTQRMRRLREMLTGADDALASCGQAADATALHTAIAAALSSDESTRLRGDNRDRLEDGVVLASRAAKAVAACGAALTPGVEAAPLIAALHDLDEPR